MEKQLKRVIKKLHGQIDEVSAACKSRLREMDSFAFTLKSAVTCNAVVSSRYGREGDEGVFESERAGREIKERAEKTPSLAEWDEFIQGVINDVQTAMDEKREDEIPKYYAPRLRATVKYLMTNGKYLDVIRDSTDELCGGLERRYVQAENSVKGYIRPARHAAVSVQPVSEEVRIPKNFPEDAKIVLGEYAEKFDADDGYTQSVGDDFQGGNGFASSADYLRSQIQQIELRYKKLIYALASSNRDSSAFALDFADVSEDCHIAVHQPRYSESENNDKPIVELLETLICRYMNLFPKTSKRLALVQRRSFPELAPFVRNIATEKNKYLVFSADDRTDDVVCGNAEAFLRALSSECDTVSDMLERTECRNLFEYNSKNYKNGVWKQLTLFIIKDFPQGFSEQALSRFNELLGKANRFGIYVIMTVCDDKLEEMKERVKTSDLDSISEYFWNSFTLCSKGGDYAYSLLSRSTYEKVNFESYVLKRESFRRERYFANFEREMAGANDPAIPLQSLFAGGLKDTKIALEERREKFFKVLRFPIGKEGTTPCHMELYQSGGGSPHVVISGTTGSGKSVLLQDIILSSMCCYTPEELEIYLFDFKETAGGFDIYKDHFFPHVKKIATECKDKEISELLKMIRKIYRGRMKQVKDFKTEHPEVNDINGYNAWRRSHGMKQIPRMMVIIDEYQTITSDENIALLLEIAQKGREYGVVLIMASQSSSVSSFGNIIKLFGHRFEFKNEPIGVLISKASSRAQELSGPHGLCFYSSGGSAMNPSLVRCAFVREDKDLPEFINYVAQKYAAYPASTYKIGSIKRGDVIRPAEYDKESGFPTLERIKSAGGEVFDGEDEGWNEWLERAVKKANGGGDRHNAGYVLNLGLNSISLSPWYYTLDKKTPYLLAYGDAFRIESLFYSAAKSILQTAEKTGAPCDKPPAYYFNGNRKLREDSPLTALDYTAKAVKICPGRKRAEAAIDELYAEYERRKEAADFLSAPIVIMVSEFISFIDLLGLEKDGGGKQTVKFDRDEEGAKAWADEFEKKHGGGQEAAQPTEAKPPVESKKDDEEKASPAAGKFNVLVSAEGARYGFFFCLQISDCTKNNYLKKHIEVSKADSVVYLDSCGDGADEDNANINQVSAFNNAFLPNRRAKISVKDVKTNYAYVFTDDKTAEYIPYEYAVPQKTPPRG